MGFDEGRIVFNSDTGIYYSGQTVFGKLIFDQGKDKTFRGIYVKVKGYCKVHWRTSHTRSVNGRRETYYVDHNSHEEYFNQKVYLVGSDNGEYSIGPGHYEYPFQCTLPATCPASYEGTHGHVRYEVKAVVDRAFKVDQEKKAVIRVIAPLDLNMEPSVKEPVQMSFDESYYCCCTSSGRMSAVAKLPVGGYVPGQRVPLEFGCENRSSVNVDSVTFKLKKETRFHAEGTKSESETVAELELGGVEARSSRNYAAEMVVPNENAPNLRGCRYIDIDYHIKVTISPDGCHSDSTQTRNIVIGTIPLLGTQPPDQITQQNVPVVNQPYPGSSPYPSNTPYPGPVVTPYPGPVVAPYPGPGVAPYPGPGVTPYPPNAFPNQQYPPPYTDTPAQQTSPYNPSNSPYPTKNDFQNNASPYPPTNSPYPPTNSLNPSNSPYPASASPYPPTSDNSPYPTAKNPGLRTGTFGFMGQAGETPAIPSLPPGAVPYRSPSPNPYAAASAPEPATPVDEKKPSVP